MRRRRPRALRRSSRKGPARERSSRIEPMAITPSGRAVDRRRDPGVGTGRPAWTAGACGTIAPHANGDHGSDTPGRRGAGTVGSCTTVGTNSIGDGGRRCAGEPRGVRRVSSPPRTMGARRSRALHAGRGDPEDHLAARLASSTICGAGSSASSGIADLVVFDPATVSDRSTDRKPDAYPAGITHVIVNGVVTLTPAGLTGARAGHRLRGFGARRQTRSRLISCQAATRPATWRRQMSVG